MIFAGDHRTLKVGGRKARNRNVNVNVGSEFHKSEMRYKKGRPSSGPLRVESLEQQFNYRKIEKKNAWRDSGARKAPNNWKNG
jgi:hypothetical protein